MDLKRPPWREQPIRGGTHYFHRNSGTNVLLRSVVTGSSVRLAPRVLQVGLLTPCNLSCHFCYRDTGAPSRLTIPFLLDLLSRASDWGVMEVAFGGGEPLLFRGFAQLLRELHASTSLGINVTTNGTLLTPAVLDELGDSWQELRLSAYADNAYRRTLRLLTGRNVGVNWLVTPENVGLIEPYVLDFIRLGARNVLLLGYKGHDAALHLLPAHLETLERAVRRLEGAPLRLDVCWHPWLQDVPHLFAKPDCGAGDEFLVITPDRAIQPCSFHHERIPFETFEDLQAIYHELQSRQPAAETAGCTRSLFPLSVLPPLVKADVYVWQAHASNNSGDYTIVGRFMTEEEARKAANSLRELARAHEAFLASPEGHEWLKARGYNGSFPTPPLQLFGEKHGFTWNAEGEGLWWEEDGAGAPVLTTGAVGSTVVVYHPYCMGLPVETFRQFFLAVGAVQFGDWQYDRPQVVATARGTNTDKIRELEDYLELIEAAEYPSEVATPPPWGPDCIDPRVESDEDRSTRLDKGNHVRLAGDELSISLKFENTFAGAVALEGWLRQAGFQDIEFLIENDLQPLIQLGQEAREPQTGLFDNAMPLTRKLEGASPKKTVELAFHYWSMPEAVRKALNNIPEEQRLALAQARWETCRDTSNSTLVASEIIKSVGPPAADWMRSLWNWLVETGQDIPGMPLHALAASVPADEAFALARKWYDRSDGAKQKMERLFLLEPLNHPGVVALVEAWWANADPRESVTQNWGRLVARSGMSWEIARRWLVHGRPLSLIALDALATYHEAKQTPPSYQRPETAAFRETLEEYQRRDPAPRPVRIVRTLLDDPGPLV